MQSSVEARPSSPEAVAGRRIATAIVAKTSPPPTLPSSPALPLKYATTTTTTHHHSSSVSSSYDVWQQPHLDLPHVKKVAPHYRPLHAQVTTLLAERHAMITSYEQLEAERTELREVAHRSEEELSSLSTEHAACLTRTRSLETTLGDATDAMQHMAHGTASTVAYNRSLRDDAAALDAQCRRLHGKLVLQTEAAQREHAAATRAKAELAVEREAWRAALAETDASLAEVSAHRDALLDEQVWLRQQLGRALEKAASDRQAVKGERTEAAQLASALREAKREQRAALDAQAATEALLTSAHAQSAHLREVLEQERTRAASLETRLARVDRARTDALVVAGRADALYASDQHEAAASAAMQKALAARLESAAARLTRGAHVAERMRASHSDAVRLKVVEATWQELVESDGAAWRAAAASHAVAAARQPRLPPPHLGSCPAHRWPALASGSASSAADAATDARAGAAGADAGHDPTPRRVRFSHEAAAAEALAASTPATRTPGSAMGSASGGSASGCSASGCSASGGIFSGSAASAAASPPALFAASGAAAAEARGDGPTAAPWADRVESAYSLALAADAYARASLALANAGASRLAPHVQAARLDAEMRACPPEVPLLPGPCVQKAPSLAASAWIPPRR